MPHNGSRRTRPSLRRSVVTSTRSSRRITATVWSTKKSTGHSCTQARYAVVPAATRTRSPAPATAAACSVTNCTVCHVADVPKVQHGASSACTTLSPPHASHARTSHTRVGGENTQITAPAEGLGYSTGAHTRKAHTPLLTLSGTTRHYGGRSDRYEEAHGQALSR